MHSYRCCGLTCGISVTGADARSGQLRVVAGSHRALVQPAFVRSSSDLPIVDLPTETGDVTVHCSCTLHMSQPPVERERRVMYTGFGLPPKERGRREPAARDGRDRRRARGRVQDRLPGAGPHRLEGLTSSALEVVAFRHDDIGHGSLLHRGLESSASGGGPRDLRRRRRGRQGAAGSRRRAEPLGAEPDRGRVQGRHVDGDLPALRVERRPPRCRPRRERPRRRRRVPRVVRAARERHRARELRHARRRGGHGRLPRVGRPSRVPARAGTVVDAARGRPARPTSATATRRR